MRFACLAMALACLTAGCTSGTTGPNRRPVAVAGQDHYADLGQQVTLNGEDSFDPDGDQLEYLWTLVAVPQTSRITWQEGRNSQISFTPDEYGVWVVRLVVSDGKLDSLPDVVKVYIGGQVCVTDRDCPDGGACTVGRCVDARCRIEPAHVGWSCNDGMFCTANDTCDDSGNCQGDPRDCSHLNSTCGQAICDEDLDDCRVEPANDGAACDDGMYCTEGENCVSGHCTGGVMQSCDDSDPCTQDHCDEAQDACTHQLQPIPGAEEPWDAPECSDLQDNDCDGLTDAQDPDCGQCFSDADCQDGNQCTINTCVPEEHHCATQNQPDGTPCDDGLYCSDPDSCSLGTCQGQLRDCSAMADTCNLALCNEATSQCELQPLSGTPCGDQADRQCDDPDTCDEAGLCDPRLAPDGQPCNDGDACSSQDTCQSGSCTPSAIDRDQDGDGYVDALCPGGDDCDDLVFAVNPGQPEGPPGDPTCSDTHDNDCDGASDYNDPDCDDDWWNPDWTRRRKLTFDNSAQNENLDQFPVLVFLFAPDRIDYNLLQPLGQDIRFLDEDDSTVLAHEIEEWNDNGESYLWVKIPRIDAASDQDFIWMYYDNQTLGLDDGQDPPAVWSDGFRAVWHLNEDVPDEANTDSAHHDSTGNLNLGNQRGNRKEYGAVGYGMDFDGVDDYIEVDQAGLQITGAAITIEAWARPTGTPNAYWHVYGAGGDGRFWQLWWTQAENGWSARYRVSNQQLDLWTNSGDLDAWNYLASRYDGSRLRLYLNGNEIGNDWGLGFLNGINTPFLIGDNPSLSPRQFQGHIDEVRISDVVRSQPWLAAQHKSMSDAGFVSYGAEEVR